MTDFIPAFGAFPSPTDYRDIPLAAVVGEFKSYPDEYFVPIDDLPVEHQRKLGACVGHGHTKYKQYLDFVDTGFIIPESPRFVYAIAKAKDGYAGEGTYPRLAAKIVQDYGIATTKTVPNDTTLSHEEYVYSRNIDNIPQAAFAEAAENKIKGYAFITISKDGLKQAIVESNGASILMRIGSEWWTDAKGNSTWDKKKIVPLRKPGSVVSGHQLYLYGYEDVGDDTKFYILNSWSKDWADDGTNWFWWSEWKNNISEGLTFVDVPNKIIQEAKKLPKQFSYKFTKTIKHGERSKDVEALQLALKADGCYTYVVTGYYGNVTREAVVKFQLKHKVASVAEIQSLAGLQVGPKTIAKLNQLFNK